MSVADESIGYDGSMTEAEFARLSQYLGGPHSVGGADDWKVSIVSSGADRTVNIAPGQGYGDGVLDKTVGTSSVQLPVVSVGSRWDLIVARRSWSPPGGITSFTYVQGTSVAALPSGRKVSPGIESDQALALVRVSAGSSIPTSLIDLRTWTGKIVMCDTFTSLPSSPLGTLAVVADALHYRRLSASGNPEWRQVPKVISGLDYILCDPGKVTQSGVVQFPPGTFERVPRITVTLLDDARPDYYSPPMVINRTPGGFQLALHNSHTSRREVRFMWIATDADG